MTRLARLPRHTLDEEQRELFDQIAGGERANQKPRFPRVGADGALEGPFNAMLLSPATGMALQALGAEVRYHSVLSDRCRELAILSVAEAWDSAYERYAHEDIGRAVGLTTEELLSLRAGDHSGFGDPIERVVVRTAAALAAERDLTDDEYDDAVTTLGERALFELVTLVGYYAAVALSLRVFRVTPPSRGPGDR